VGTPHAAGPVGTPDAPVPVGTPHTPGPAAAGQPIWRRALPFVLAVGLVGWVLSRLDLGAFVKNLTEVNVAAFAGFTALIVVSVLAADTFATVIVYRRSVAPVSFRDFFTMRGASYLPSILNHHVGQAFVTYFVARAHRVAILRVAGATLVGYASWMGCLVGLWGIAFWINGKPMIWVMLVLGAGVVYLLVIASRPRVLADNKLLGPLVAPLFEAGVGGHLIALAARVPHLCVLFLGTWLAFWFFGVHVPPKAALESVPLLMVVVTLPLTPQGFGTRDALAATLFEQFAMGETKPARLAAVAAATTSWGVASTLGEALLGLWLTRRAMRLISK